MGPLFEQAFKVVLTQLKFEECWVGWSLSSTPLLTDLIRSFEAEKRIRRISSVDLLAWLWHSWELNLTRMLLHLKTLRCFSNTVNRITQDMSDFTAERWDHQTMGTEDRKQYGVVGQRLWWHQISLGLDHGSDAYWLCDLGTHVPTCKMEIALSNYLNKEVIWGGSNSLAACLSKLKPNLFFLNTEESKPKDNLS